MEEKDKELEELAKPLIEWLIKNYDPMCSIIIENGRAIVVRKELQILID